MWTCSGGGADAVGGQRLHPTTMGQLAAAEAASKPQQQGHTKPQLVDWQGHEIQVWGLISAGYLVFPEAHAAADTETSLFPVSHT